MPNSADTIEKLARQLEQQKILYKMKECKTLEDFQNLVAEYQAICDNQDQYAGLWKNTADGEKSPAPLRGPLHSNKSEQVTAGVTLAAGTPGTEEKWQN